MDPYLEDPFLWGDFHFGMNAAIREYLNQRLPADFVAAADRYVWIHEPDADDRMQRVKPDVHVAERGAKTGAAGVASVARPPIQTVLPAVKREGNRFIRIMDRRRRTIVTVIELLSPANKSPGPDREAYIIKRNEFLASQANVVEIDLLRGGDRMVLGEPPPAIRDYYAMVLRAAEFPTIGIWPFTVRDPLPDIPIPLRDDQADVVLSLKDCFDHAFEAGRCLMEIDYQSDLVPPLSLLDAEWARSILSSLQIDRGEV
jgi:hypothetical protein